MKQNRYIKLHIKQIIFFFSLFLGLLAGVYLINQSQENRKRAAEGAGVTLVLSPASNDIVLGDTQIYVLTASFSGGSATETLDYFRTQIEFDPQYLEIPASNYIDTSQSGFDQIFRVDGPTVSNLNGKIIIELGSKARPGPATNNSIILATIYFRGKALTPGTGSQSLAFTQSVSQVVDNQSIPLVLNLPAQSYRVVQASISPTPTLPGPTSTPIQNVSPTPTGPVNWCPLGDIGNLDCANEPVFGGYCVDTSDVELFRQAFGQLISSLTIPPTHHTPDLYQDSSPFIDVADYNILYQNFGYCSLTGEPRPTVTP